MLKRAYILVFLMLFSFSGMSQVLRSNQLDSAMKYLERGLEDTNMVKAYFNLSYHYQANDPVQSKKYARKCLDLALKLNYENKLGGAYACLGGAYRSFGQPDSALILYRKAIDLQIVQDDSLGIASNLGNLALTYSDKGEFTRALVLYDSAQSIIRQIQPTRIVLDELVLLLNNMGTSYKFLGIPKEAVRCYEEAIDHLDPESPAIHRAMLNFNLGGLLASIRNFSKASEYIETALAISEKDSVLLGISMCYSELAGIEIQWKKDPEKVISLSRKSLKFAIKAEHKGAYAYACQNLARGMVESGQQDSAKDYFERGRQAYKELGHQINYIQLTTDMSVAYGKLGEKERGLELVKEVNDYLKSSPIPTTNLMGILGSMSYAYSELDMYPEALEVNKKNKAFADSLYHLDKEESFARKMLENSLARKKALDSLSIAKQNEIQDLRMAEQNAQLEQAEKESMALMGGLAFILLIAGISLKSFHDSRKIARSIELEKKEIEEKKEIAEEERDKARHNELMKRQFLANMSHEIRTPMNAILGITNILIEKDPKKDHLYYLHSIRNSADLLLSIINDILDVSKLEAGKMDLEQIPFSLHKLFGDLENLLRPVAEKKGLLLDISIPSNLNDGFLGDPVRLEQVLINLLNNAIKFTEDGRVSLKLEPIANKDGIHEIKFTVEDQGIGMSPDQVETVFGLFKQATDSTHRKYGGSGLGLTIAKEIIELYDSELKLESEIDKGSRFSFVLKLQETILPVQNVEAEQSGSQLDGISILIAEDNPYNRLVVNDFLKLRIPNVKIDNAHDGIGCLEFVRKEKYDLILMDVQMPEMNGLDATRAIRKMMGEKALTPIIAMTASVIGSDIQKCYDAGMNGYVPKPFRIEDLLAEISQKRSRQSPPEHTESKGDVRSTLSELTGGDENRMQVYLEMYIDSMQEILKLIEVQVRDRDFTKLEQTIHACKPQFKTLGLEALWAEAGELEELIHEGGEESEILRLTSSLESHVMASLEELS